ncbi:MAG: flavin-dependent oxidoreductase, partial [Chloroflexi bacterium]|nr:flavin-dependent oxidoreductase [Chloroflexota bacterium]
MKFHWFHLMPYQELPKDFSEKYHSVWVDVPSHLFDPVAGHRFYNEYLDELEFAAESGFDGICVNEHHQNAYGMMPSPNIMAASL